MCKFNFYTQHTAGVLKAQNFGCLSSHDNFFLCTPDTRLWPALVTVMFLSQILWRVKLLFHKWLYILTACFLSNQTMSDFSLWNHLISFPNRLVHKILPLTYRNLLPTLFYIVKLVADIYDTVLSPPLTASSTAACVYRKRIQSVWMSCFNIYVRHTDVLKLYHMSLHVQYFVSNSFEIYWCSKSEPHVTPCAIVCFNIHVRFTDVLKLFHI